MTAKNASQNTTIGTYEKLLRTTTRSIDLKHRMIVSLLRLANAVVKCHCERNHDLSREMRKAFVYACSFSYENIHKISIESTFKSSSSKEDPRNDLKKFFESCLAMDPENLSQKEYFDLIKKGLSFLPEDNFEFFSQI